MIQVTEILDSLGAMLGIELSPGENGSCQVLFGDDAVDFQVSGRRLFIMADLGRTSVSEAECAALLKANCLGEETLGATIGLDAERQVLTMHLMLAGAIEEEEFKALLADFVKAVRYWKAWAAAPASSEASPSSDVLSDMLSV